jgi:hypothetical protein
MTGDLVGDGRDRDPRFIGASGRVNYVRPATKMPRHIPGREGLYIPKVGAARGRRPRGGMRPAKARHVITQAGGRARAREQMPPRPGASGAVIRGGGG